MFRTFRFMTGIVVSATVLSFPVASGLLYLFTRRFAMPGMAGGGLQTPEEVAGQLSALADRATEQTDG
jgi:hypothetical protein